MAASSTPSAVVLDSTSPFRRVSAGPMSSVSST
jgi:hypothetical protein